MNNLFFFVCQSNVWGGGWFYVCFSFSYCVIDPGQYLDQSKVCFE